MHQMKQIIQQELLITSLSSMTIEQEEHAESSFERKTQAENEH